MFADIVAANAAMLQDRQNAGEILGGDDLGQEQCELNK